MDARTLLAAFALTAAALVAPAVASAPTQAPCETAGATFPDPLDSNVLMVVRPFCAAPTDAVPPAYAPATTCASTAYRLEGVHTSSWFTNVKLWTVGSGVDANGALAAFSAGANAWDNAVGRDIFGSIGLYPNVPGTRNGVNEVAWHAIDASTIAVTYYWVDTRDHHVLETDAMYNAALPWSLSGAAGAYDVQSTATHEWGHSFGLDHPTSTGANACLTMYAYGAKGETQKRSLAPGDLNGIHAIYGA